MLKKILHIAFSAVMALLLVFGDVSKEYLHLFTGHTDTVHQHDDEDGLHFENEHHHCSFLAFTLPHFVKQTDVLVQYHRKPVVMIVNKEAVVHLVPRAVPASRLRGPPRATGNYI